MKAQIAGPPAGNQPPSRPGWDWIDRGVWTDRMLNAPHFVGGGRRGTVMCSHASFGEPRYSSLGDAWPRAVQSLGHSLTGEPYAGDPHVRF